MMKFIFQDPHTWSYLHDWKSEALEVRASFFFHDRGTSSEKSFEGLLGSVVRQIIEQQPPTFPGRATSSPGAWTSMGIH